MVTRVRPAQLGQLGFRAPQGWWGQRVRREEWVSRAWLVIWERMAKPARTAQRVQRGALVKQARPALMDWQASQVKRVLQGCGVLQARRVCLALPA